MSKPPQIGACKSNGGFPKTRWSLVVHAGDSPGSANESKKALAELCQGYWYPIYSFIRRSGVNPSSAEDLTQGFFEMVISTELFPRADREKGKLRTFLLTAVTRYLGQQRDRANAQKRGGGVQPLSIDSDEAERRFGIESKDELPPDQAFEKRWALELLDQALVALGEEQRAKGRERQWEALKPFLAWNAGAGSQQDAASELGVTVAAFRAALLRLRRRYRAILSELISHTVDDESSLDDEIAYLFQILSR